MRRRKHRGSEEVNLTPLLDVLFSILFIVMFAGAKIQNDNTENVEAMQTEISELNNEINELNNEVTAYKNQETSYDSFLEDALIVTVDNIKSNNKHILRIFAAGYEDEEIILGINNTDNIKKRLNGYFENILIDKAEQPIYIVYNCDDENIYKTEFDSINSTLLTLEKNNKEVFYKISEDE